MRKTHRVLMMASLTLAGESIYMLPYALRRDYENVMLQTMGLSNTELGWLTSMFGVFALACYFPGGWLADRVSARKLLTLSLVSTGLGGLYMATFPGYAQLVVLHAVWGVTTILTFWGALIKATRGWGGDAEQGRAFGILEGGRGLFAFVLAAVGGLLFASFDSGAGGLHAVILLYSCTALAVGALTWLFIPEHPDVHGPASLVEVPAPPEAGGTELRRVLSMPVVWLQAVVILTAYAGYWGTFDLSKLAVDAFGAATYALRGVFYALLDEGRVPMDLTGLTVGVVSVIGYAPDVFIPPLKGWLLDRYPGALGHRYFFGVLAAGAVVGAAATLGIGRIGSKVVVERNRWSPTGMSGRRAE